MTELKNIIEVNRLKKGLTKSQLAKLINVSPAYITRLENGSKENPSLEIKIRLAKALDINVFQLMNPEDYFAGSGLTPEEISEFDEKIDTKKLAEDVKIADYLTKATTQELIEELNKRTDFPVKIKIK